MFVDQYNYFNYSWRLEYFKKQYRQWFEPQTTRKLEIAKKRLNLEISATEEMVLMSICDQVKTCKYHAQIIANCIIPHDLVATYIVKYFIESKGVSNKL